MKTDWLQFKNISAVFEDYSKEKLNELLIDFYTD